MQKQFFLCDCQYGPQNMYTKEQVLQFRIIARIQTRVIEKMSATTIYNTSYLYILVNSKNYKLSHVN